MTEYPIKELLIDADSVNIIAGQQLHYEIKNLNGSTVLKVSTEMLTGEKEIKGCTVLKRKDGWGVYYPFTARY